MEPGLLPTHILSFLPHGIQIIFMTSPEAGREKKGLPISPRRDWKKRNSRNCVQCSPAGDCLTNGCTINLSIPRRVMEWVYASAHYSSARMQMLRKGHPILSTGKGCAWFRAFIFVVPLGERDSKEKTT